MEDVDFELVGVLVFEMTVVEDVRLELRMADETEVFVDAVILLDRGVVDVEAMILKESRVPWVVGAVLVSPLPVVLVVVFNKGNATIELGFNCDVTEELRGVGCPKAGGCPHRAPGMPTATVMKTATIVMMRLLSCMLANEGLWSEFQGKERKEW